MTRNPAFWEFLERYQDFITNGLDLISFLLVTPELLLLVRPLIQGRAGEGILRVSAGVFATYVTMFGGNAIRLYVAERFTLMDSVARFFPFFAGAAVFVTFGYLKHKLTSWSSRERLSSLFSFNLL